MKDNTQKTIPQKKSILKQRPKSKDDDDDDASYGRTLVSVFRGVFSHLFPKIITFFYHFLTS